MSEKLFDKEIAIISKVMQKRLIEKQEKRGDEWKVSDLNYLRERIIVLYDLVMGSVFIEEEMKSLIDLSNQCMLLYLRLKEDY